MNIVVFDPCPIKSAELLDDLRANKFTLEDAQMLATAVSLCGGTVTYKNAHINHPCSKWVRQSRGNYRWLLRHFVALCKRFRRDRGKPHGSEKYLGEFVRGMKYIPEGDRTPFVNCAANKKYNLDYKHLTDVYDAYKLYMADRWELDKRTPTWQFVER